MKKLRSLLIKKIVYLFLVPLIIFMICSVFAVAYILSYQTHFTVMPVMHTSNADISIPSGQLTDNQIIRGRFTASNNNLGTVALRIHNIPKENINDDYQVTFRIKEAGAKTWYSSNTYSGGQFHELELFPFGFNLIADSEGKPYEFEMFSKGATAENGPQIDQNQRIVSHYQLNKSDLKNPISAIEYGVGKFLYIFHNIEDLVKVLVYYLPLFAYFYLLAEGKQSTLPSIIRNILLIPIINRILVNPSIKLINWLLKQLMKLQIIDQQPPVTRIALVNILLFVVVLLDVIFVEDINNLMMLLVLLLWGITILAFKLSYLSSFLIACGFLTLCLVLKIFQVDAISEKSAVWAYVFFALGTLQTLFMFREQNTAKATLVKRKRQ
jgi:hypothetical protein